MNNSPLEKENTSVLTLPQELYSLADTMSSKVRGRGYILPENLENHHGDFNGILWPYETDLIREGLQDSDLDDAEKELPVRVATGLVLVNELSAEGEKIGEYKKLQIVCGAVGVWSYTLEMPIKGSIDPITITYWNRRKDLDKKAKKNQDDVFPMVLKTKSIEKMFKGLAHAMRYRLENFTLIENSVR